MPITDGDTVSGLPADDVDVTVLESEFTINNDIAPGAVFLRLKFDIPGGDARDQFYSVGNDWEPAENGARLKSTNSADKRKMSRNSNYGKWLDAVKESGAFDQLDGSVFQADTWMGTRWHMNIKKFMVMNPTTKVEKESSLPLPTKFLGTGNGQVATAPTATKPTAAPRVDGLPLPLLAKLNELALGKDHDAFMGAAFDLPEVEAGEHSVAAQNAIMASGPGSIWQRANA